MENYSVILMERNAENNFLEKEVARYSIEKLQYIDSIYLKQDKVYIDLIVNKEVADWEFNAILDYYEEDKFDTLVESISEVEDTHNPTWRAIVEFKDSDSQMQDILNEILDIHENELEEVYEAIKDKEDEYKKN